MTTSSITAATPGTRSPTSPGPSCRLACAVEHIGSNQRDLVLLGLATTSSSLLGVVIGLYCPLSKRVLACVLAFAAGTLISALAIELAFQSVQELHHRGFGLGAGWAFAGSGFALGATIYYGISRYLEAKGAAIRSPARFREYAREQKRQADWAVIPMRPAAPFAGGRNRRA